MADQKNHPEQDPAEGSRETIDRELARQDKKAQENGRKVKDDGGEAKR
jgi:hypothetical protein